MARPPAPRLTPRPVAAPARDRAGRDATPADARDTDAYERYDAADDGFDDESDDDDDAGDTQALAIRSPGGSSEYGAPRRWTVLEPAARAREGVLRPQLVRALRAGLESVIISWLLVTVPVIAAYVATVASPTLGEASWLDAARSGSAGWLLGLGQEMPVVAADGTATAVTLAPLALTLLTAGLLAGSVRRARLTHPAAFLVAALAAAAAVGGAYSLAEASVSARAGITTAVVVAMSVTVGAWRSGALPALPEHAVVTALADGARSGLRASLALVALGVATVLLLLLTRASDVLEVQRALGPDALSTVVLVVGQLLALPTFAVWALSWWLGPGFSIGLVDVVPAGVTDGPLPVIPILAAIPESGGGPGAAAVVLPVLVLTLALTGVVRRTAGDLRRLILTLAAATVTTTALLTVLAGLSGGADGATVGPLAAVGTSAPAVALAAGVTTALASVLAWLLVTGARRLDLPARYPVLREVAAAWRRVRARVATSPLGRRLSRG
ncbi:cell division protein PerM [Serinibacter arcticus]|uniref:Putative integral membrane protein n=1 Tax=Serinibacter arcticus TaxID=1655435 RepID=A0A4Z1E6Z4_9MICO|nr:DUF6350 family protein [Serinibacter arcticus]TGO06243.1 putative integral membrane protein [Serinibacter arcticus]